MTRHLVRYLVGTPLVLGLGFFVIVGAREAGMSDVMSVFPMLVAQLVTWQAVFSWTE